MILADQDQDHDLSTYCDLDLFSERSLLQINKSDLCTQRSGIISSDMIFCTKDQCYQDLCYHQPLFVSWRKVDSKFVVGLLVLSSIHQSCFHAVVGRKEGGPRCSFGVCASHKSDGAATYGRQTADGP